MNQFDQYPTMNPTFTVEELSREGNTATLVIEPLEQGYGHTIGNALRRVMLGSLPGYAITKVRVEGIDHQFSSLEGLKEDNDSDSSFERMSNDDLNINEPSLLKKE